MNLSDPTRKLEVLLKAEAHVMRFQRARIIKGLIAGFLMYIFLIFAYVMLNIAGFLYFFENFSGWIAALFMTGVNIVLCLIVFMASRFQRQSPYEKMAFELRQIARQQICNDVQVAVNEIKAIETSIRSIRDILRGPAAFAGLIRMILTVVSPLMKTARKRKKNND